MARRALYNTKDTKLLEQLLDSSAVERITLSFYRYHQIEQPGEFRDHFYQLLDSVGVLGRIYVAGEGINAQLSVPKGNFEAFEDTLAKVDWLNGIRLNIAIEDDGKSFAKLVVKVREKIVADGLDDNSFNPSDGGQHLDAVHFNELAEKPDTIIVDMRNHYESEVGYFKGAIRPDADTFREALKMVTDELSDKKDQPIVMYCTGGIRCEKASAWLKHNGYKNVFQLDGGIINYARQVESDGLENNFVGKNFVFDRRMGERITETVVSQCHQCGEAADTHVNCANDACHQLFIQCSKCAEQYQGCCSEACIDFMALPEEEQRERRKDGKMKRKDRRRGRLS